MIRLAMRKSQNRNRDGKCRFALLCFLSFVLLLNSVFRDVAGVTEATQLHLLRRREHITVGTTDWIASAGTNTIDSVSKQKGLTRHWMAPQECQHNQMKIKLQLNNNCKASTIVHYGFGHRREPSFGWTVGSIGGSAASQSQ